MNLPSELLLQSFQDLNKTDLKNARLVCKLWSGCASESLFAKIFISPHKLNVQVFFYVAEDPILSRCVKELEYDAVHFSPDTTKSEYFEMLWSHSTANFSITEADLKHPDPEICRFMGYVQASQDHWPNTHAVNASARMQCSDSVFVQEGYRKWMDQAASEKKWSEGIGLLSSLVHGLRRFSRLRTVTLNGEWSSRDNISRQGSPLARSWHRFHARPRHWDFGPGMPLKQSSACKDFWTLAFALSEAKKTGIRTLSIRSRLPPIAFCVPSGGKQGHLDYVVAAYCRLEFLDLWFAGCSQPMIESYGNLHGLQCLLESMTVLKQLELNLPYDVNDPKVFFPYTMIFPGNGHWPQLTTFTVRNLAIGTKDLATLLITKMPNLRHLSFGAIRLLDGSWEGIVEYLRVAKRLHSFRLDLGCHLLHRGNRGFYLDCPEFEHQLIDGICLDLLTIIQDYVVDWWKTPTLRHPSLAQGQPAHASLDYLYGVFRLCGMHGMGTTIDELMKHMLKEAAQFAAGKSAVRGETPLEICR